jgi:NAD(P)-dependent dehydrogenase (short-subunit alcohol dehydrogenase family)
MGMDAPRPVCLITGGASGLGRAAAHRFGQAGYDLVIGDIDTESGQETAAELQRAGIEAKFVRTDVADPLSVGTLVETTMQTFGRLNCAVNSAAIEGKRGLITEYEDAEVRKIFSVNFMGVFSALRHEIAAMLKSGGGSIVNIGSSAGLRGTPHMAAYSSMKHALIGLTRAAALEYAGQGIRVNIVSPGSFKTPMSVRLYGEEVDNVLASVTPLLRAGSAEEIAEAIFWLGSPASSFVTGANLAADGGKTAGAMLGVNAVWRTK